MLAAVLLSLMAGCSTAPPAAVSPAVPQVPAAQAPAPLSAPIAAELLRLRESLHEEVPDYIPATQVSAQSWTALAKAELSSARFSVQQAQLLVVVDRNPRVQELMIMLAQPPAGPWQVIGGGKVSTGQAGRYGYFITPTGVFVHDGSILDYRALGTFNENHIRGLGMKGMRVWDFGWQEATEGWRTDGATGEIRLLMHATDPDFLEPRLGRPASKGCIRISKTMNLFLDRHGILDADYERIALDDPTYAALLLPDRQPSSLAGNALVVVDSAGAH
jgi:hypothetical protein